jgi:hypothetical protein
VIRSQSQRILDPRRLFAGWRDAGKKEKAAKKKAANRCQCSPRSSQRLEREDGNGQRAKGKRPPVSGGLSDA